MTTYPIVTTLQGSPASVPARVLSENLGHAGPTAKHGGRLARGLRAALALLLLAAPAAATPTPPQAKPDCTIAYRAGGRINDLIEARGITFDGYDRLCPMLAARRLGIQITSQGAVLEERSYGWVSIVLFSRTTRVAGSYNRSSTHISRTASTPRSDDLMMDALADALTAIAASPEQYIAAVATEEAGVRRALAAQR